MGIEPGLMTHLERSILLVLLLQLLLSCSQLAVRLRQLTVRPRGLLRGLRALIQGLLQNALQLGQLG